MNVTFPDNATIQIFVVPSGVAAAVDAESGTPRILLAPPVRRRSRQRDVLFLGTGAILCIAVLSVVRFQATGHPPRQSSPLTPPLYRFSLLRFDPCNPSRKEPLSGQTSRRRCPTSIPERRSGDCSRSVPP